MIFGHIPPLYCGMANNKGHVRPPMTMLRERSGQQTIHTPKPYPATDMVNKYLTAIIIAGGPVSGRAN
jgi:hypothetical protein